MRALAQSATGFRWGLRFRLMLLLMLACAPLMALILHRAWEERRAAEAEWRSRLSRVVQTARREELELHGSSHQLLLALSESASVRSLNPKRCKRWVDALFERYPRYSDLGVIRTNGDLLASAASVNPQVNYGEAEFFRRAISDKGFAVSRNPGAHNGPEASVSFGLPVLDGGGKVIAVVFAEVDLRSFYRSESELPAQLPPGAVWTEIDHNGEVFCRYPEPGEGVDAAIAPPDITQRAFARPSAMFEAGEGRQDRAVYATATFPSLFIQGELAGVLSIPRRALFAEADRALQANLVWLAVAATAAMAVGLAGSRLLVVRPVEALVRSSTRLASGDLRARTGMPHSRDELGQLTLAFDTMAQALEQRSLDQERANERLRLISHRLAEALEAERRHIARELHDEIGQSLTTAELSLEAALQSRTATLREQPLKQCREAIRQVTDRVHDLSLNLRPTMLDDLGLEPTLRWYIRRQEQVAGWRAEFAAEPLNRRLESVIETECFRVAQEALTNISRHSKASCARVELGRREGQLHLNVEDDGVGFDVAKSRSEALRGTSLGLLSMEERAKLVGGGLEIFSTPGQGTMVHAWFPLRWQNEHQA